MSAVAEWLHYERTMHLAAIARIDERLAGLQALGGPLPPKTPAAIVEVLRLAHPKAMSASGVLAALEAHGRSVTREAVCQALYRLAKVGAQVERVSVGRYRWKDNERRNEG